MSGKSRARTSPVARAVWRRAEAAGRDEPGAGFEFQAERMADAVIQARRSTGAHAQPGGASVAAPGRQGCHCGGTCPRCRARVQRRAAGSHRLGASEENAIAEQALNGTGQTLSAEVRAEMESRFGHDFQHVRIHTDDKAARSARAMGAEAYTVGSDIAFERGRYAPGSDAGAHLLAHELAHVVQQGQGLATPAVQRKGGTAGGFFSNFGRSFVEFFGGEIRFTEEELQAYLTVLDGGDIEDDYHSDDKARQVVKDWRPGGSPYILTAQRKALLIKEMQSDFTGDDDEEMILELLERAYNYELAIIFGIVDAAGLNDDFHGEEWKRLQAFYASRFEGGMEAVLAGEIKPTSDAVPLGIDLKHKDDILAEPLAGAKEAWNIACVLGLLCSRDSDVINALPKFEIKSMRRIDVTRWTYDGSSWKSEVAHPAGMEKQDENGSMIGLIDDKTCDSVVSTLVHEVRHTTQADGMTRYQREVDAYTFTESWNIERGLPGNRGLRQENQESGKIEPNPEAIDKAVRKRYGGPEAGQEAQGEEIVGHEEPDKTVLKAPDGSRRTRTAEAGDVYLDDPPTLIGEHTIAPESWVCPKTAGGGKAS